jgi:hypothetical protein
LNLSLPCKIPNFRFRLLQLINKRCLDERQNVANFLKSVFFFKANSIGGKKHASANRQGESNLQDEFSTICGLADFFGVSSYVHLALPIPKFN